MPPSWALTWSLGHLHGADRYKHIYRQGFTETQAQKTTLTFQPCPHLWLETNITHTRPNSHLNLGVATEPVSRSHPGAAPAPGNDAEWAPRKPGSAEKGG